MASTYDPSGSSYLMPLWFWSLSCCRPSSVNRRRVRSAVRNPKLYLVVVVVQTTLCKSCQLCLPRGQEEEGAAVYTNYVVLVRFTVSGLDIDESRNNSKSCDISTIIEGRYYVNLSWTVKYTSILLEVNNELGTSEFIPDFNHGNIIEVLPTSQDVSSGSFIR